MTIQRFALILIVLLTASCGGSGNRSAAAPPTPPATPPTEASGLSQRPNNTSCIAGASPAAMQTLDKQRAFPKLTFSQPVLALQAPNDASRWFVVEQAGRVLSFANDAAVAAAQTCLDIRSRVTSGGELGLLSIAFHPSFPANPHVYVSYTATASGQVQSRISEFSSSDAGATLDGTSERVLLTIAQPEDNHNGGYISFGPDGYLYAGFGDGGGAGDMHGGIGNGQKLNTLLGKMLRINIDAASGSTPYAIPGDNPFAANAACTGGSGAQNCPEIFAWGFRNPWRWNFDLVSGALWVADVGQSSWEEVDRVTRGGNYGWRCREGAHPYSSNCGGAQNLIDPVAEYSHSRGLSITGGFVYRGSRIPSLVGRYVFADYSSGRVWSIPVDTAPTLEVTGGVPIDLNISSFAQGIDHELMLIDLKSGGLFSLIAQARTGADVPSQLSQTGCIDMAHPDQPVASVIPYAPNAPFWSDGAEKTRFIGLPNGASIGVGSDQDWTFPPGTVLVKNFKRENRLIETRLFMHHTDDVWAGYTYEWNDAGTEATRVVGGKQVDIGGSPWIFPSEEQCLICHTAAAGRALGLETAQLNGTFHYPGPIDANQVATLRSIGVLDPAPAGPVDSLPRFPDPADQSADLTQRARAYLHVNCSQCHRPNGGTPSNMDLRAGTALADTSACAAAPQSGNLGIADAALIAPGSSDRSLVVARMNRRDANAMPPLASAIVDADGVALISAWIDSLASCN